MLVYKSEKKSLLSTTSSYTWQKNGCLTTSGSLVMNNEKLGAAPQKHAGGDTKQAIKPKKQNIHIMHKKETVSG